MLPLLEEKVCGERSGGGGLNQACWAVVVGISGGACCGIGIAGLGARW